MIIIKFGKNTRTPEVLFEGSLDLSLEMFDVLTEEFESNGEFMINEINVGSETKSVTLIREFATEIEGQIFDLIICGGITSKIVK